MAQRHKDALAIVDPGACNPSGIVHSLLSACSEIRNHPDHKGTEELTSDPAIQLMVFQLASICGVSTWNESWNVGEFMSAIRACKSEVDSADALRLYNETGDERLKTVI